MAQQNEGWPLGLQPLHARMEIVSNGNNSGSMSFNTLLTGSPSSSTNSSSDLDTQSTGSFFIDNSTTLGSLMGVNNIVELSRRSIRGTKTEMFKSKKDHNKFKFSSCLLCLCSRSREAEVGHNQKNNPPSLGQFLAVERRVANGNRKSHRSNHIFGPHDELNEINNAESNSLFVNGTIAPPLSVTQKERVETEGENMELEQQKNEFGSFGELFSCMFRQNI